MDGEDEVEGWEEEMLKGEQICLMHAVFHLLGQSELCFKSHSWAISQWVLDCSCLSFRVVMDRAMILGFREIEGNGHTKTPFFTPLTVSLNLEGCLSSSGRNWEGGRWLEIRE